MDTGEDTSEDTVEALTPDTWHLFAGLVERQGGMFGSCWCSWFHEHTEERGVTAEGNRDYKRRLVEEGKVSSSFLYNGTRTRYERVGFTYDRPKGLGNCVMRLEVAAAALR